MPASLLVVINAAADPEIAPQPHGKWRDRLESLLRLHREQQLKRRLRSYARLPRKYAFIDAVRFRSNQGQDFGAYDLG